MAARASEPEVRWSGRGRVQGETIVQDEALAAACDACGQAEAPVVVFGGACVCAECMRQGLNALSVARWRLDHERGARGLPWGKISG